MITREALKKLTPYVPGRDVAGGVKLSSNENPRGPSAAVRDAIVAAAGHLNRYPDSDMRALREAISAHWRVSPEMVIVGNGSDEILQLLAAAFVEPGTTTVTAEHTFSEYSFATLLFDGEVLRAPMTDLRFDLTAIANMITDTTRMVFLCNPNNPTGTVFSREELLRFMDRVPPEVVVVIDEAYGEYAETGEERAQIEQSVSFSDSLPLVDGHPNLIRLRTFSKVYGLAGLRVGYGIANPSLISRLYQVRQPFNVGSLSQIAAVTALQDQEYVAHSARETAKGRGRLYSLLDTLSIPFVPSWANFVCADFGPRAAAVVEALTERGFSVRPLSSFGLPTYLRISVGLAEEMDRFSHALTEVLAPAPTAG